MQKKSTLGYFESVNLNPTGDKKCKKIPKGHHVGRRGYLEKDEDDENESNGSSNGNGGIGHGGNGNGGGGNGS